MRLGINATFLNETPTGIGVFTIEVLRHIFSLNRDILVFTSARLDGIDKSCIVPTPLSARGSMRLADNVRRFFYINSALPFQARRHGISVLYCPIMEFPFVPSSPLVVTLHDLHALYFPEQFGVSGYHYRAALRLLPLLTRRVTVPSMFVKKELLETVRIGDEKVDVVYNGYNSSLFKPQDTEMRGSFLKEHGINGPYILFVGSLFLYKNVKTLIRAFEEIRGRIPHKLVIIGKKELSPEPITGDDRIHCFDYIENNLLPKFYSYADVLVHPSLFEGFGMTILEAMACGTPVISSNGGSLPEVAGDAAMLFNPEDSSALAGLLVRVISDKVLRNEMTDRGLVNVEKFSWERTAEGILRSCEKALKER